MEKSAYLILSDGRTFEGSSFGFDAETSGEVVFNTSITGYQEILTDPSYHGQIVVMTAPHIGNCGVNPEDMESDKPQVAGFIVRSYSENFSNWRGKEDLASFLKRHKIVAGTGFDTRAIVRHIRDKGAMPAILSVGNTPPALLLEKARALPSMNGQDLARIVTCKKIHTYHPFDFIPRQARDFAQGRRTSAREHERTILYDFGVKQSIITKLQERGLDVTVVPATTSADDVIAMKPSGIVLSNGPGDPAVVTYAIESIKKLLGKFPIFGICLGHQILALALGGRTYKLKFGHRGGNQPVMNVKTGRVEITSQNHGFAVEADSIKDAEITHINLNDRTIEGFASLKYQAFSVQYHPEASPGPHDAAYLFDEFLKTVTCDS